MPHCAKSLRRDRLAACAGAQLWLGLIAATTFLSCLALPIPASVIMLAAGGFSAAGDLDLAQVVLAALAGAVAGDQLGYALGRWGGARLVDRLAHSAKRGALIAKAQAVMQARGGVAVFLTRWLFSPLGPYVNLIAGAARQGWLGFTLWATAGEAVWCGLYVGMGRGFAGNLSAASDLLGSVLGLVASLAAVAVLGWALVVLARQDRVRP